MSAKDLSRTVIEGGRARRNVHDRRWSHREERAREREYLRAVQHDPSLADARSPEPRDDIGKWFADKLGAAERWLLGHVGRPWRKVEGEILATFDTRTLAGRHIVFDHLLPQRFRWRDEALLTWRVHRRMFFVDARGVLRVRERGWPRVRWPAPGPRAEVVRALGQRRVVVHGERLYWLEPTGRMDEARRVAYRQSRALDAAELAWWRGLTEGERELATTPELFDPARHSRAS